jgi:phosphate transport system permease protein
LKKKDSGSINYKIEQLRLKQRSLEMKNRWNEQTAKEFADTKAEYDADYIKRFRRS